MIPDVPQNTSLNQRDSKNLKKKEWENTSILNVLEHKKQTEKIKRQNILNKTLITKKEITDLLTQDSYYRKLQQWPLLTFEDISPICQIRNIDDMFNIKYSYFYENKILNISSISKNINRRFHNINKLLTKFKGHLVACGGKESHGTPNWNLWF